MITDHRIQADSDNRNELSNNAYIERGLKIYMIMIEWQLEIL